MLVMEELLKPEDVARILGLSEYTIKDMFREGELKGFKVRREWRMRPTDLQDYIKKQQEQHNSNNNK